MSLMVWWFFPVSYPIVLYVFLVVGRQDEGLLMAEDGSWGGEEKGRNMYAGKRYRGVSPLHVEVGHLEPCGLL